MPKARQELGTKGKRIAVVLVDVSMAVHKACLAQNKPVPYAEDCCERKRLHVPCNAGFCQHFPLRDQKQIIKGDVGGIVFRADTTNYTFYYFFVTQNGDYGLLLCPPGNTCRNIVASTFSSAIHQGLGQTNVIAVVAQGSMITLYVNNQKVASVTDNIYSHGQVGVVAAPSATNGHPTEVAYNNAKVWTL